MQVGRGKDKKPRKIGSTVFKAGQSGNPAGRPKGAVNATTKAGINLRKLAAEKATEAFDILWDRFKEGDKVAMELYFKTLLPKRSYQKMIVVANEENLDRSEAIKSGLKCYNELTHSEAMDELKVFKDIPEVEEVKEESKEDFSAILDRLKKEFKKGD